jgi:hypothetical protein
VSFYFICGTFFNEYLWSLRIETSVNVRKEAGDHRIKHVYKLGMWHQTRVLEHQSEQLFAKTRVNIFTPTVSLTYLTHSFCRNHPPRQNYRFPKSFGTKKRPG